MNRVTVRCRVLTQPSPSRGALLFHPEQPDWVHINSTAIEILALLERHTSSRAIARAMARRHGIGPSAAEADVRSTLDALSRKGFLDKHPRPLHRDATLQSLQVHVTERCNLACAHCHLAASPAATLDMPTAKILGLIDEAAALGARRIVITGGEPLLHPGLKRVMRAAARRKMAIRLSTNGTLIDEAWADFLAALKPDIQISLDGPDARTHDAVRGRGRFAQTSRAVARLQKAGLGDKLILSTTVQGDNLDRLEAIIDLAEHLGVPKLRFLPPIKRGRAANQWRRVGSRVSLSAYRRFSDRILARQASPSARPRLSVSCGLSGFTPIRDVWPGEGDFWCFVGTTLVIAADGKAYPCSLMMREAHLLGDASRQPLARILRAGPMTLACRALADRRKAVPVCAACAWANLCQAGCMGAALDHKGTIMDVDRFCAYRKKLYGRAFRRILRRAGGRDEGHAVG